MTITLPKIRSAGSLAACRPATRVPLFADSAIATAAVQPVTVGIPFPRALLSSVAELGLRDAESKPALLQADCLARWPDGSVKWALLDFILPEIQSGRSAWRLEHAPGERFPSPAPVRIKEDAASLRVDTGTTTFCFSRRLFQPFEKVLHGRREILDTAGSMTALTDSRGRPNVPQIQTTTVEANGPVRATVRMEGEFAGLRGLRFRARLSFYAGTSLVRLAFMIHNPNRARHKGGLWDLGDPGAILFRDLSLVFALQGSVERQVSWIAEPGQTPRTAPATRLEIYQDSSGGDNWNSRNHVNRHGRVPCSFRGYRVHGPGQEELGLRANPVVTLNAGGSQVSVAVPEFWQQFPKALEVDGAALRVRLFPQQFGDLFELQGGEQKTHVAWLDFDPAAGAIAPLTWVHSPARVHTSGEWYSAAGAMPFLMPRAAEKHAPFDSLLAEAISGPNNLFARRETIDEYGWRNFGELYADHEAVFYQGTAPVISHYNNQYDVVAGALIQYLRTGDGRWFDLFDPLARHVIDIDIYHTDRDRPAYNGGLFWHSDHYRDAATCTHRTYSRANQRDGAAYGGGPCNEHNYSTGLLLYYYLTGDVSARDAVIGLADWVIAMDDGRRNFFGLFDDGPTGIASRTRDPEYHGPGRGAGNSINALLDGWLLTKSSKYIAKAEELIRRVIHPGDDIEARNLLNAERRWSYTVLLAALGRYLSVKRETGSRDFMCAYARASLLVYAKWMEANERPYLDEPDRLEYPTETWAAQDLRKANVMRLAAGYAPEPLRSRLVRRAAELAERAWSDLIRFPTRSVTRSLAVIMAEGPREQYFHDRGPIPEIPDDPDYHFGRPVPFVSQRRRILRQLTSIRGAGRILLRLLNPKHWGKLFLPR
jgi:hypothetical protein